MNTAPAMRAVVVDDEAPARRKILRLLRQEADIQVVAEADGGHAAVAAIAEHRPDLVFLDVQMPGLDGFGVVDAVAQSSPAKMPRVVFITAHDQHALRAFEVHALNYLLKPVAEDRFREVVQKAREQHATSHDSLAAQLQHMMEKMQKSYPDRLLVHKNGKSIFVPVKDVTWIEADRNYVLLHCGPEEHTLRTTIESIESMLDPRVFVRLNRSSLVRLDAIRELIPWFHGEFKVFLHNGPELRWSRRFVSQRPELLKLG
jgi:two-component system LytT family response regulator